MTPSIAAPPVLNVPLKKMQHVVILASAGSGKTHELSGRYLTLLAAGAAPNSILASTFTRAAAGEIRDRLLRRLAESVGDKAKRAELCRQIGVASLTPKQVTALLAHVARHLHVLQVRTLDAFFASIARAFGAELGLPAEASIIDEVDDLALRHEAMRLLLEEREPQVIVELLRLLTRGDSDRGVMKAIDRVVGDLYGMFLEADAAAWECVPHIDDLLTPPKLQDAINALVAFSMREDDRLFKQHSSHCAAAAVRDWNTFLSSGIAKKLAAGETDFNRKPIPPALIAVYQPLIDHLAADMVEKLRQQTLATRDLLALFDRHYRALKHRQRVLTFSDLTHAMARVASLGDTDTLLQDIGFRLDGRIGHLLLDEFQDTSAAQWRALQPMSLEVASQQPPERSFFCVGDVKQSIYGWRGASPEILERLPQLLPGVMQQMLDVSWRSSPIVINAVNTVFSDLPANRALSDADTHEQAAADWGALFHEHVCADKVKQYPGYVQLRFAEHRPVKGDSAFRVRKRLELAAKIVADLHHLHAGMRIGVLTRSNASVARLLYELGPARLGIAASGRGGGPLIDAPPVNAILDLLRLANHPDDTIAAFNVANSPLGKALGLTDDSNTGARRKLSRETRQRLMLEGYQPVIADWVAKIASQVDVRELRRATQLVELAGVHDQQQPAPPLRMSDFIALVEGKDVPDAQPAPVEVMTIHQAKGLEFDAVVLPDLETPLRGWGEMRMICERDGHSGLVTRICRYADENVRQHVPGLEELVRQQRIRTIRERLSTLYVAMTRARFGLYMLVDPPKEIEKTWPKTAAGLVRGALAPDADKPGAIAFETGDAQWMRKAKIDDLPAPPKAQVAAKIVLRSESGTTIRGDAAVSASAFAERAVARKSAAALRANLQLTNPEGRERGSVIHALFERIEWLEDFTLDDSALMKLTRPIAPRRDEQWHHRQIAAFRSMLAKPAIAAALSRGDVDAKSLLVHRELPYVRATESGIQSGSIDRLVMRMDSRGRAAGATIIDFKTDAIVEVSVEAQAETHREQLQMYRKVVAEMFGLAEKNIAMQVLLVGAGAAIDL